MGGLMRRMSHTRRTSRCRAISLTASMCMFAAVIVQFWVGSLVCNQFVLCFCFLTERLAPHRRRIGFVGPHLLGVWC